MIFLFAYGGVGCTYSFSSIPNTESVHRNVDDFLKECFGNHVTNFYYFIPLPYLGKGLCFHFNFVGQFCRLFYRLQDLSFINYYTFTVLSITITVIRLFKDTIQNFKICFLFILVFLESKKYENIVFGPKFSELDGICEYIGI